jgi:hypothetical protein
MKNDEPWTSIVFAQARHVITAVIPRISRRRCAERSRSPNTPFTAGRSTAPAMAIAPSARNYCRGATTESSGHAAEIVRCGQPERRCRGFDCGMLPIEDRVADTLDSQQS